MATAAPTSGAGRSSLGSGGSWVAVAEQPSGQGVAAMGAPLAGAANDGANDGAKDGATDAASGVMVTGVLFNISA